LHASPKKLLLRATCAWRHSANATSEACHDSLFAWSFRLVARLSRNRRNTCAAPRNRPTTGPAHALTIDGRHPAAATDKRESVMQKIVELNMSEIEAVTGGHKTYGAAITTATTAHQRPVGVSASSAQALAKPTISTSATLSVSAYRL
jgi:hypothetical protein